MQEVALDTANLRRRYNGNQNSGRRRHKEFEHSGGARVLIASGTSRYGIRVPSYRGPRKAISIIRDIFT